MVCGVPLPTDVLGSVGVRKFLLNGGRLVYYGTETLRLLSPPDSSMNRDLCFLVTLVPVQ